MELKVKKSSLQGRVKMPGSKSHTIRSVVIASLAEGESRIEEPLLSADTRAAVDCMSKLGAEIECGEEMWQVRGTGGQLKVPDDIIDVANSGTTLRFAVGSCGLLENGAAVFTGDEQIRARPMEPLIKSLNELGATCFSTRNNGRAPLVVRGKMRGGETSIEALSSQYLSSLLINVPLAENDSIINVIKLNEQPYVEITLKYLDEQGIKYNREGWRRFEVEGGQKYKAFQKRIPADFSSATFFLCAGAILEGELVLEGLDFTDSQGDKAVVDILKNMGADIEIDDNEVTVRGGGLEGMEIDLNSTPDALPALAVVGCFAKGQTRLYNVPQARMKETDRIKVMAEELGRMGGKVQELSDGLVIEQSQLQAANLKGYADHRVVMALSLAGMALKGESTIDTAEAVSVTFPDYVELMQSVGAKMEIKKKM